MNAQVLETIKRSAAVPSMPQVVMRFLQILRDPNFEYADLVKVLSTDPGTVGEILRLANSALFGVRQKVSTLQRALTLLGPKRTRSLLLSRYLVDTMGKKSVSGLDMSYFWRRSLASAVVASRFAETSAPKVRDDTFIAALLADIGIPILTETLPDRYAPLAARHAPHATTVTPDEELQAVQVTHADVSAMVLAHWSIPENISDAVNLHQTVCPGKEEKTVMARLLRASDSVAKLLCEVSEGSEIVRVCTEATAWVGLDLGSLSKLLPSVEQDVEELADVLRVDLIPSSTYELIAKVMKDHLSPTVVG